MTRHHTLRLLTALTATALSFATATPIQALQVYRPTDLQDAFGHLAFFPGGDRVLAGQADHLLQLTWPISQGANIDAPADGRYTTFSLAPHGPRLATLLAVYDGYATVTVSDTATGRVLRSFPHGADGTGVALLGDGSRVAFTKNGRLSVFDVATSRLLKQVPPGDAFGPHEPQALAASSDGRWLLAGSHTRAFLWDLHTDTVVHRFDLPDTWELNLGFSGNGRRFYITSDTTAAQVFDTATQNPVDTFHTPTLTGALNGDGTAYLRPDPQGLLWRDLTQHTEQVVESLPLPPTHGETPRNALAISAQDDLVVTLGPQGTVQLWGRPEDYARHQWRFLLGRAIALDLKPAFPLKDLLGLLPRLSWDDATGKLYQDGQLVLRADTAPPGSKDMLVRWRGEPYVPIGLVSRLGLRATVTQGQATAVIGTIRVTLPFDLPKDGAHLTTATLLGAEQERQRRDAQVAALQQAATNAAQARLKAMVARIKALVGPTAFGPMLLKPGLFAFVQTGNVGARVSLLQMPSDDERTWRTCSSLLPAPVRVTSLYEWMGGAFVNYVTQDPSDTRSAFFLVQGAPLGDVAIDCVRR